MVLSRIVWLLTGLAWATRSTMEFASPDYWEPVTTLDWASIWLYSIAWLLMAPSVLLIARLAPTRSVVVVAVIASIGAVMAGGANAVEDGLGVSSMGTWYVIGFMAGWLALPVLALALVRAHRVRLAGLVLAVFGGIVLLNIGGGLIVLGALGSIAIVPDWYTRRSVPVEATVPEPAV